MWSTGWTSARRRLKSATRGGKLDGDAIPRRILSGAGEQKGSESCALKLQAWSIDGKPQQNRTKIGLHGYYERM